MMEEQMKNFLKSSGFSLYIPEFHVAKIFSMESLRSLCDRPELLSKIVALDGHRERLLEKIQDFNQGNPLVNTETEDLPVSQDFVLDTQDQLAYSTPKASSSKVVIEVVQENGEIHEHSAEIIAVNPDTPPSPERKRQKTTTFQTTLDWNKFTRFEKDQQLPWALGIQLYCTKDISEILERTAEGKYLAAIYEQRGFDNKNRIRLATLVINAEYGGDTNTIISTTRFQELAKSISETFPGEEPDTYYVPAFTPVRGKTIIAKGKLYDKYTSLNKELREASLRNLRPGQNYVDNESAIFTPQSEPGAVEASLKFLERNLRPWESIVEHWKRTSASRLNDLLSAKEPTPDISEYLEKFPCLKQKEGYQLLELDFDLRFPDASLRIYSHWEAFSKKVKAEIIKLGLSCDNDVDVLRKFPQLFSVVPVKIKNHKSWRADRPAILQGFLHMISKSRDFTAELEAINKEARTKHFKVQPFPLLVGEKATDVEASYFVIDNTPILLESPLRALEVAFKSYFALHCEYPIQSQRLWIVLQKTLFDIHVTYDRVNPVANLPEVRRLIKVLNCN